MVGKDATDTASVFPIELLHESAPSDTQNEPQLVPVDFTEIEFEDCTSHINLDLILDNVDRASRRKKSDDLSNGGVTVVDEKGKRKAFSGNDDRAVKRLHAESQDDFLLAKTACRFEILVRLPSDIAVAKRIKGRTEKSDRHRLPAAQSIARLSVESMPGGSESERLLPSSLRLEDKEGCTVAILPIVDTDRVDMDRKPHRFSNGRWLESLGPLVRGKIGEQRECAIRVEADLDVVADGPSGPYSTFAESFVLELKLHVYIRRAAAEQSWVFSSVLLADHLDRLIRFGFPRDEEEAVIRSHTQLDTSTIYSSLHSSTLPALDDLQPPSLNPGLFPFQKKSVHFLLGREGKEVSGKNEDGFAQLRPLDGVMAHDGVQKHGLFWREIIHGLFYNPFTATISTHEQETRSSEVRGGMLAEEMGLGKTVEIFALILLHPDPQRSLQPAYFDEDLSVEVAPTKTTLIVAPEVLRQQWLDEAALHVPELRAFSYLGYKEAASEVPSGMSWFEFARQFDLMVVSFDTLRKELNVARKAPARSRRFERKYERPRSLLIQLAFHRVVMDEVQLVGHTLAAETVAMIARNYSIAVSGTPLKQLSDLQSLFKFLRVPGPIMGKAHWLRLLQPALIPTLSSAMAKLATRFTKPQVRLEMVLPQQTRILVPITFTAIESAFYRDIYHRLLSALGIDLDDFSSREQLQTHIGSVFHDDVTQLRSTLLALRQACTHPQIASTGVRGTALATSQSIRSMDEVLTIMIEGSKSEFDSIWHSLIQKRIDRAVLLLQQKENEARHEIAKAVLMTIKTDIEARVNGIKEDLQRAKVVGPLYKFEEAEDTESRAGSVADDDMEGDLPVKSVNGYQSQAEREREADLAEKRVQRRRHIHALQSRLRNFLEQLHRCFHFLGNIHFQMGEKVKEREHEHIVNDEDTAPTASAEAGSENVVSFDAQQALPSRADREEMVDDFGKGTSDTETVAAKLAALKEMEEQSYDRAEEVRQDLLKETRKNVEHALSVSQRSKIDFDVEHLYSQEEFGSGGIRSTTQFEMLAELQDKLNAHTEMMFKWRDEIWKRLEKPVNRVVSAEDENDDQYQENLDAQTEAEALLEMYRVLISEREYMLTGVRIEGSLGKPQLYTQLEREVPQYERAKRRMVLQQSGAPARPDAALDDWMPSEQQIGVMRQQLDHFRALEIQKNQVAISREAQQSAERLLAHRRAELDAGSGDGEDMNDLRPFEILSRELRDIAQNIDGREEVAIIRTGLEKVRRLLTRQRQLLEKARRESAAFSTAWNVRAAYFKQIQDLSDQVGDIAAQDVGEKMNNLEREEATLRRREEMCAGRLRYLRAIEEEEEEGEEGKTEEGKGDVVTRTCPICTEALTKAVVLDTCGHTTCEACFRRWTAQRGQCPMCKTRVNLRNIYRVTYNREGKKRRVEVPGVKARNMQSERFNVMEESMVQSIQRMPIRSTLGSKLDLLTRHLLYLERIQPGVKSLIFTAFSRGISLVGDALRLNGIKFVTLDQGGTRGGKIIDSFKNNGGINVLLLHSEAQSSGLNLVCAQNIFLLEPLVNHSLELQAIGRVHRIGQTRPTTVFSYAVSETVEHRIVEMARRRGQSLFTRDNCISHDLKDSAEMAAKVQQSKGRTSSGREGEYVAHMDDLVDCLFDVGETAANEAVEQASAVSTSKGASSTVPDAIEARAAGLSELNDLTVIKPEETEIERMRRERLEAIQRRQATREL